MNPKVSILVPVYNVSLYIEQCVISLFNQTFDDIEYIFVNDDSQDDSMSKLYNLLELYPLRKNQVKILHHAANRGLAAARNTALDASTGEYISIVDSDDFVEPKMIEQLYNKAIEENADIVVSDYFIEYKHKSEITTDYVSKNKDENIKNIIIYNQSCTALWNKLFRRNLYIRSDCRVPEGLNYFEDRYVTTRLYFFANRIVKVNEAFYHYSQYNVNAITKTKNQMHFENVLQFWNSLDQFLKDYNVYDKYQKIMELPKIQSKVRLIIDTHSYKLRKQYSFIFKEFEMNYLNSFRKGEILMLLLVRYKMFWLAQLFHNYLLIKSKKLQ